MRKIIIGASKSCKLGSKLIQWWIEAPYSHVYARWYLSDQDREIVYQASHGMVHFKEFNNFTKENQIVKEFVIDVTCEQFQVFSQRCIDLAGQPYSVIELIQILVSDVTNGRIHTDDQPGYICSELMTELLESLGYKTIKPKYLVSPKDIVEFLESIGAKAVLP